MNKLENIIDKIKNADLSSALEMLIENVEIFKKINLEDINELFKQIIIVSSNLNALNKDITVNILSYEEITINRARITNSLIQITEQISKYPDFKYFLTQDENKNKNELSNNKIQILRVKQYLKSKLFKLTLIDNNVLTGNIIESQNQKSNVTFFLTYQRQKDFANFLLGKTNISLEDFNEYILTIRDYIS